MLLWSIGKLLVEVNIDDVPHSSQFDDELPPPLPPKKFEEESQYDDVIEYGCILNYLFMSVVNKSCLYKCWLP